MGMGFQPTNLEPKHLVALSEGDVVELREALALAGKHPDNPDSWAGDPENGARLWNLLNHLPDLYEGGTFQDNLSERGIQALERMVKGVRVEGLMNVHRPGATVELIEELSAAIREQEIAEAHLTISLFEGHPGPERSAIVARDRKAKDRLSEVALRYGRAVMAKQEKKRREEFERQGGEA